MLKTRLRKWLQHLIGVQDGLPGPPGPIGPTGAFGYIGPRGKHAGETDESYDSYLTAYYKATDKERAEDIKRLTSFLEINRR